MEPCEGELIVVTVFEIKEGEVLWFIPCDNASHLLRQRNGAFLNLFLLRKD